MPYRHTFLYPDYYPGFACKCGDCRATCCRGWGIALSQDEYFRVMGLECSAELRRRLDVAFRPATDPAPTPERYALISYNWLGQCPLHSEDGLCALHRECGEETIPEICRRYPRCVRVKPTHECCTSTACERTLELLWESDRPFTLVSGELSMYDGDFGTPAAASMSETQYIAMRMTSLAVLSDRTKSIDGRIAMLAESFGVTLPYHIMPAESSAVLYARLAVTSDSLFELSEDVEAYYADGSEYERFSLELLERSEIYVEKMLANHLFFKGFPRSFEGSELTDELAALVAVRGLHRYAAEAYLGVHGASLENLIDVTAKLFRMIEHSRFDEVAARFVLKS